MVIRYNDILTLVTTVGDQEGLRVTVTESAKGGLIAGAACALGGVLLGPPGLAVGGAVGGCLAAYVASGKFKSVSSVILEDMSPEDQQKLVDTVQEIIGNVDAGDAVELVAMVQGNALLKAKIVGEIVTFFSSSMNMPVTQSS